MDVGHRGDAVRESAACLSGGGGATVYRPPSGPVLACAAAQIVSQPEKVLFVRLFVC